VAIQVIVDAGIIEDCLARRFKHVPGDVKREPRIIESPGPGVLIHHPNDRALLTERSTDAVEGHGLVIGKMVQDKPDGPLAPPVCALEVARAEREALQRLVASPFKLSNELRR
jgi:hypothetical protein